MLYKYSYIAMFFLLASQAFGQQEPKIIKAIDLPLLLQVEELGIDREVFIQALAEKGVDVYNQNLLNKKNQQEVINSVISELLEAESRDSLKLTASDSLTLELLKTLDKNKLDSTQLELLANLESKLSGKELVEEPRFEERVYGQKFFTVNTVKDTSSVTSKFIRKEYKINTGDEISISIFGVSQYDGKFIVDDEGFIDPNTVPRILVQGLTEEQAKEAAIRKFQQFYRFRKEQLSLRVLNPVSFGVSVVGEVQRPGTYTFDANASVLDVLFRAGGLTENATVRNIRIIDEGRAETFDLYDFLLNANVLNKFSLRPNMIVQVVSLTDIAHVTGAVNREHTYEIKDGESIASLVTYASGLRGDAFRKSIQVIRFSEAQKELLEIDYDQNKNFKIQNGDSIIVRSIKPEIENVVYTEGAFEQTGIFSLERNTWLSDLVQSAELVRDAKKEQALFIRENADQTKELLVVNLSDVLSNPRSQSDFRLKNNDKLLVYEESRYADQYVIKVKGAVKEAIEYPYDPSESIDVYRALLLSGGLAPEATEFAYIIRTNPNNPKDKEYIRINIQNVTSDSQNADNLKLRPLDELLVLSNMSFTDEAFIYVDGAVHFPDTLIYDPSLQFKDVLTLVGGVTDNSDLDQVILYRQSTDDQGRRRTTPIHLSINSDLSIKSGLERTGDFELLPHDRIEVRMVAEYEPEEVVFLSGEVKYPGTYALVNENETLKQLVQRAGGLTQEAFVEGISLEREQEQRTYNEHVVIRKDMETILKSMDNIVIPKKDNSVSILPQNTGSEFDGYRTNLRPFKVTYSGNKSAKWYINKYAGGLVKKSQRSGIYVRHANGSVESSGNFFLFRKMPKVTQGSTIYVAAKEEKVEKAKEKSK